METTSSASQRRWLTIGAASAFVGVACGAFGAHALEGAVPAERLATWETAARYQLLHALALIAVAWAAERLPGTATEAAGWLFLIGTALFSGSLYALTLTGVGWLGAVTPLGGVAFLGGWACLVRAGLAPRAP